MSFSVCIQFNTAVVRKIIIINIFGEETAKYEWIKTLWNYQSAKKCQFECEYFPVYPH